MEKVGQRQQCDMSPCWIKTQHINITCYTLYPAESQGQQKHLTGLKDVCCHDNIANNTDVSHQQAYKGQKTKNLEAQSHTSEI